MFDFVELDILCYPPIRVNVHDTQFYSEASVSKWHITSIA